MTSSLSPTLGGGGGVGHRWCLTGALYSIIYGSLCILLVFLGFIWCSASHAHQHQLQQHQLQLHQQFQQHSPLPNNLQNHRLSPAELSEQLTMGGGGAGGGGGSSHGRSLSLSAAAAPPPPMIHLEGKEDRMDSNQLEGQPSSNTIRRSYQSSGYGGGSGDYSGGYSSGQQQQNGQYGQQQQQQQIGRQFGDPMFPGGGGGGGGGGYPGMSGFGMGASGYYPSGFGLENRFLSLFPRRSSFYQPYYPYGPFGAAGSLFPGAGGAGGMMSPFGGGGGLFGVGNGGGGHYGGGGYPGMGMGGGGGGLGSAFGALGRLAQASSLLTGGLQSYRERLQPGSMLGSMAAASAVQQSAPPMHHYNGEVEGTS